MNTNSKAKILVVEDEAMLREGVADILSFEGFEVMLAENGEQGLLAVFQGQPDLILCDIMMPVMDGLEMLYRIRTTDNTKLIPFILMTALAERADLRAGMELGSDDYLTKPFTREELLTTVSTRLRKSRDVTLQSDNALNDLRSRIIGHLPHEMRTPLNGIMGFSQMLIDFPETITPQELPEIGRSIFKSAQRLHRLIRNYLLYIQLEMRQFAAKPAFPFSNADKLSRGIAIEVANSYKRFADLELNLTGSMVLLGEAELEKVVEELVDNAFKFSGAGTKVSISSVMNNDRYILSIEDHGCGISHANISRIGAYMQFDRHTREQQGSGLGLIIVKKLVEYCGGQFLIKSIEGEGTSIQVSLPVK